MIKSFFCNIPLYFIQHVLSPKILLSEFHSWHFYFESCVFLVLCKTDNSTLEKRRTFIFYFFILSLLGLNSFLVNRSLIWHVNKVSRIRTRKTKFSFLLLKINIYTVICHIYDTSLDPVWLVRGISIKRVLIKFTKAYYNSLL